MWLITPAHGYVAVYDSGGGEQVTPIIVWQQNDRNEVHGLVAQAGYTHLKTAHTLPGFKRYERFCE